MIDQENYQKLSDLVEKITTSGQSIPDKSQLTAVKKICRLSDEYVKHVFRLVMSQLEKEHAEIRLSSFHIIDELFMRSHCFRELLIVDLQRYMELTMEIDIRHSLPLPHAAAKELKHKSFEAINKWNSEFSNSYKLLALGYNFLKNCRKINFENIATSNSFTPAEQRRGEELRLKRAKQFESRIQKAVTEMTDLTEDIKMCLLESENCITLLLPHPDNFHIDAESSRSSSRNRAEHSLAELSASTSSRVNTHADRLSPEIPNHSLNEQTWAKNEKSNRGDVSSVEISSDSADVFYNKVSDDGNDDDDGDDDDNGEDDDDDNINKQQSPHDSVCETENYGNDVSAVRENRSSKTIIISVNADRVENIKIRENDNNSDVIRTLKDQMALVINKYLPAVKKWLEVWRNVD